MDDTNPDKEDVEYVDAIQEDIRWLGYDWDNRFYYASDYFETMYEVAVGLIKKGPCLRLRADAGPDARDAGDLTHPAVSPVIATGLEESLDLFARMRAGEFPDGRMTPAGENRSEQRELQYARPGNLPDQPHPPSPPGGQMVRISHVRFCPSR